MSILAFGHRVLSISMCSATDTIAPAHCVGPDYRPKAQKPTATISTEVRYDNVHILPQTSQLIALLTYAATCPFRTSTSTNEE